MATIPRIAWLHVHADLRPEPASVLDAYKLATHKWPGQLANLNNGIHIGATYSDRRDPDQCHLTSTFHPAYGF